MMNQVIGVMEQGRFKKGLFMKSERQGSMARIFKKRKILQCAQHVVWKGLGGKAADVSSARWNWIV